MKNLRGKPRNISDSGILYETSDSDEYSEFSDSDDSPVTGFFPLPGALNIVFQRDDLSETEEESVNSDNEESEDSSEINNDLVISSTNVTEQSSQTETTDNQDQQGVGFVHLADILPYQQRFGNLDQQNTGSDLTAFISRSVISSSPNRSGQESSWVGHSDSQDSVIKDVTSGITTAMTEQSREGERNALGEINNEQCSSSSSVQVDSEAENITSSKSELIVPSTTSSILVPYPDIPDYVSGDEQDANRSPINEDKVKSFKERASLKRSVGNLEEKTIEEDTNSKYDSINLKNDQDGSEDDDEQTCNPMVSDAEECDETEEAFRGDRIGNTVYSERHVLKILMKWIEDLPCQYSVEILTMRESDECDEAEMKVQRMDVEFEEQMSLLWDMSAETDVMNFLVENKIFLFIRDTLGRSACSRLTEIALGILANVISQPSIIEDFAVHDSSIQLVERVVDLTSKVTDVAVLIQVFSVLRRIVWYLRNVSHLKKWHDVLQSASFLGCANFILSSSRNVMLLGNVVMLFFTFLECLSPDNEEHDDDQMNDSDTNPLNREQTASGSLQTTKMERMEDLRKKFSPFCDTQFVPALCEGLEELMKNPKTPNAKRKLTSMRETSAGTSADYQNEDHYTNADDIDILIPEGHVQQSILNGLSILAILQKAPNGQDVLKRNATNVINFLLDFCRRFLVVTDAVTRSSSLEYFALSLHLLSFCHTSLESVNQEAIVSPISTASKLMSQEERDKEVDMVIRVQLKDGIEFDSVSYIGLVAHEYLASVAERFGPDCALNARNNESYSKFFKILDDVVVKFIKEEDKNHEVNIVSSDPLIKSQI